MLLETAVNTTRQNRNRTQTSFNAETQRARSNAEEKSIFFLLSLRSSANLCVSALILRRLRAEVLASWHLCAFALIQPAQSAVASSQSGCFSACSAISVQIASSGVSGFQPQTCAARLESRTNQGTSNGRSLASAFIL